MSKEIERAIGILKLWRACPVRFGGESCLKDDDEYCEGVGCWKREDIDKSLDMIFQAQLDREKEPDNTAVVRCLYDKSNDTIIFKCTCGQVVERKDEYWNYCPKCGKRLVEGVPKENERGQ